MKMLYRRCRSAEDLQVKLLPRELPLYAKMLADRAGPSPRLA